MTNTISLLVENHQGVLSRISGLFSGRGYNLESFTSGITRDPSVTRITLVCNGDKQVLAQIKKQLEKLIDVLEVVDLTDKGRVDRELALIKVGVAPAERGEIFQIVDVFQAKVTDVGTDTMTIEITGQPNQINDLLSLLCNYNIQEIARSGLVSMEQCYKGENKGENNG